jgi:hypothetical protein
MRIHDRRSSTSTVGLMMQGTRRRHHGHHGSLDPIMGGVDK